MRKGVRCELDTVGLPDEFLLAGALPTLHDRYGISTAMMVEKLSIVCVNDFRRRVLRRRFLCFRLRFPCRLIPLKN